MTGSDLYPGPAYPEIRRNPVTGARTILAPERSRRPGAVPVPGEKQAPCPFCTGNESLTPPEIWAVGREKGPADSPGWKLRVIPNLYPALAPDAKGGGWKRGIRVGRPARGYHEVIVHSPHHERSLADMNPEGAVRLMGAYRLRYEQLASQSWVKQVLMILNHKKEAGTSIAHPHTQVFALPIVPRAVRDELRETRRHHKRGCLICAVVEEAREDGRMVLENERWVAFTPYASRSPYETWFVPHRHEPDFAKVKKDVINGMADILHRVLRGLSQLLDDPPYNLWLHSAPCDGKDYPFYHWHVELAPRITIGAGFELATGTYIDIVSPEDAARRLGEAVKGTVER